ncbi:MAG: lytic transglycosylase domain-containing protein [Verrucomicrobiota bacterium]
MLKESLEREKIIWVCVLFLGAMVLFHQVALAVKTPAPEPWTGPRLHELELPKAGPVAAGPSAESAEAPEANPFAVALSGKQITDLLIEAIVQIESAGNPRCVGGKGERGLMQIRQSTWNQVSRDALGQSVSFDCAFNPETNVRVGRAYLGHLQQFLRKRRDQWQADERSLLLACYNAGPNAVRKAGFNIDNLPESVQSYARRGSGLHGFLMKQERIKASRTAGR